MAEDPMSDRLKALEQKIEAKKRADVPPPTAEGHLSGAELAWRMVIELVAGLGLGVGIGYGLDVLFGTLPWLMILFTGFGFAAGVKVMLGTAKSVQENAPQGGAADEGKD